MANGGLFAKKFLLKKEKEKAALFCSHMKKSVPAVICILVGCKRCYAMQKIEHLLLPKMTITHFSTYSTAAAECSFLLLVGKKGSYTWRKNLCTYFITTFTLPSPFIFELQQLLTAAYFILL